MARKTFFSFHYQPDNWRASQVRNIGAVEGNQPVSDNDWETVAGGGDTAIKNWIDQQMNGRSCTIVLIGAQTAGRKWVRYEVGKTWNDGKGLVGVHIHKLQNSDGQQTSKGANPFGGFTLNSDKTELSSAVQTYDPPYASSSDVYAYIKDNLASWVEEAVTIRNTY